jgi:hypothetical protein
MRVVGVCFGDSDSQQQGDDNTLSKVSSAGAESGLPSANCVI